MTWFSFFLALITDDWSAGNLSIKTAPLGNDGWWQKILLNQSLPEVSALGPVFLNRAPYKTQAPFHPAVR